MSIAAQLARIMASHDWTRNRGALADLRALHALAAAPPTAFPTCPLHGCSLIKAHALADLRTLCVDCASHRPPTSAPAPASDDEEADRDAMASAWLYVRPQIVESLDWPKREPPHLRDAVARLDALLALTTPADSNGPD